MINCKMMFRIVTTILLTLSLSAFSANAQKVSIASALDLYESALYQGARSAFEQYPNDPYCEGYIVLCAMKAGQSDYLILLENYRQKYTKTALSNRIGFEYARILFDESKYGEASLEFESISANILNNKEIAEYMYKSAYCAYALGNYEQSKNMLTVLEALEYNDYTAPGYFLNATMYYNDSEFSEAESYFKKSILDPRFKQLSEYYIVDCEFNQKNYEFTISEGEKIYQNAPDSRRERLARMISEAALILGDNDKARLYYEDLNVDNMNRKDYFYSGTVLYAVKDYEGAIQYYSLMTERSDSLGQIANYHLANSYLSLRNQVAAMDAFKDAAAVDFDPQITEDAFFNYAKLAFDLNKDRNGFKSYMDRYSISKRGEQIYGYMALAALYDRDYAAAVEAYDQIEELSEELQNNYTKANYLRAQQLFAGGSYRDAIPFFRATAYYLPKSDRLSQSARYWLAESYYRTANYAESFKLFEELYNASALYEMPESDVLSYNAAYCAFLQNDYATASRWFDKYITSAQKEFREDAMRRRADCDFGLKDYKAAIQSYQRVRNEYESADIIYPYYQQALSYGLAGDKNNKLKTLLKVQEASSDSPLYNEAWYELGRTQLELKKNNDAIKSFTTLNKTAKTNEYLAKSLSGLGLVYRNMSKYDDALNNYKEIVKLLPNTVYSEEALLAIESIYQSKREPDKFLEYLEANSLNKNKSEAEKEQMYFNTAEQLYFDGNYATAISSIEKFNYSFPRSDKRDQANFYLAESYRGLGDKEKAVEQYSKMLGLKSDLPFVELVKLRYAELSFDLERYADSYKGYKALSETTKIDQNKDIAKIGMMRSAYRDKNFENAVSAAQSINTTDSDISRESKYVMAKSYLGLSKRKEAMAIFKDLSNQASTPEGAEANYMLIQNYFDSADFDSVENAVYNFAQKAEAQVYWLAKAYLVLGDTFTQRKQYTQAKATYESIRDGYEAPQGGDDIADNVNMRIQTLNDLMQQ